MGIFRFYLGALLKLPTILGKAWMGYVALLTTISSTIGYFGIKWGESLVSWWEGLSPWWGAMVPVMVVVIVLFLVAVHRQFREIEEERDGLREEIKALKGPLANAGLQARVATLEARPRTEAEQLKHNCLQSGTALSKVAEQWLAEYREAEARETTSFGIANAQIEEEIQSAETEEEKQRATGKLRRLQRWEKGRKISVILERARREYDKNFRDRAMKLFESAEEHGLAEPQWKWTAKNAGGSLQRMRSVAERLIRIGNNV